MKHTVKKRETKLFQSHSGISVLPVYGHWHIFITDCGGLCYLCVVVTIGHFQLLGMMELGQLTLSGLMLYLARPSLSNAQIFGVLLIGSLGLRDSGCGGAAGVSLQGAIVFPYFFRNKVVIIFFIF